MSIFLAVFGISLSVYGIAVSKTCSYIGALYPRGVCLASEGCIWEGTVSTGTCKKDPAATCAGDPCDSCFDVKNPLAGGSLTCDAPCIKSTVKDEIFEYEVCASTAVSGGDGSWCSNVKAEDCTGFSNCYVEGGLCLKDACASKSDAQCIGECSVVSLGVGVSECLTTGKHSFNDSCTYYSDNSGLFGGLNICNLGDDCTGKEVTLLDGSKGVVCKGPLCNCKVQLVGPYYVDSYCGGDGPNTKMTNEPGLKVGDNRNYQNRDCPYHIVDTNNNDQWVGWAKAADLRTESGEAFSLDDGCCRAGEENSGTRMIIPMMLIGAILFFLL